VKHAITEYLQLDVATERWECIRCGYDIGPATASYKEGLLIAARDPSEVWQPEIAAAYTFAYDRDWARVIEFYCPGCATLMEVELLPPGHPVTDDIRVDVEVLRGRDAARSAGAGAPVRDADR
jgi:acetone carboxylase, gamma subunit